LDEKLKAERSEVIRKISNENRIQYMDSMIGKKQRILIEKVDGNGMAHGYGEHYLPILFKAPDAARNVFREVVMKTVEPADPPLILGEFIPD